MNGQIGHLMQTDVGTPGPEQPSSSVKVVPHCEGHKGNLSAEDKGSQVLLYNCGGQAACGKDRLGGETLLMCTMQPGDGWAHARSDWLFHGEHHAKHFAKIPVAGMLLSPFAHEETDAQRVE